MSDSHGDMDADWGPESEELDEEPSAMQFSNAVSTRCLKLSGIRVTPCIQIHSKGVVEQPAKKLKARNATDPPPIHNGLSHERMKEPEQNRSAVM